MPDSTDGNEELEQQLDAIIAAYYRAIEAGECVDQKDFIAQHPELQKELGEFFADLGMLHAASPQEQKNPALEPTIRSNASPQPKAAPGSVVRYFGEYEILEELGAGGMGVVYKARQTKLKRIVAIKMIRAGELANSQDVQRFEAEAKAAAKLSHPGIVSVHEVGIHNGQHFYTMDYVEGGSLSRLHRDKPVESKRAAKLVKRLAESMHYAHQQNIIHRDLKPANILLTAKGAPRITDFGLAKHFRSDDESRAPTLTESGQILGTAGYMSPEQAVGKSRLVGPASDVYSLGAVLYALLTGHAPFVGETPSHTILQVLQKEPISPRKIYPSVPRDLETICLKCLEKEPHKRYGTAQLLADDLRLFLEGKPVKARPVSSIERGWRWCRRNSVLTALLVVILLVVLCSPVVVWYQVATIVDGVQDARGAALPELISDLHKYPSFMVTSVLNRRFKTESNAHRKLNLAFALAQFGTLKAEYLVSQVGKVIKWDSKHFLDLLARDPEKSLTLLHSEVVKCSNEKDWRRKSQLAILALHLGDPDPSIDMCRIENRPDPVQRTIFIDEFPKSAVRMTELGEFLKSSTDPGLRSAMLLSAGSIPQGQLSIEEKGLWQTTAADWYVCQPDRITHSAAECLLRQWEIPLPEISQGGEPKSERRWQINSQGQTFLLMQAGTFHQPAKRNAEQRDRDVAISESFWLMDREVSVGQFLCFVKDAKHPPAERPVGWPGHEKKSSGTMDFPVQNISWINAVLYCNWLSGKEGFSHAYKQSEIQRTVGGGKYSTWRLKEGSNGYRLPFENEWEYACRAGTTTDFASGDDTELLRSYAQYQASATEQCGKKYPNAWGLWDMHGNVDEWCDDPYARNDEIRFLRGGSFNGPASYLRSSSRFINQISTRSRNWGFRLARSTQPIRVPYLLPTKELAKSEIPRQMSPPIVGPVVLKSRILIESGPSLTSVQHSLDGSLVLLGGFDHFAGLFDLKEQKKGQVFQGHEQPVWSVALSQDGRFAVTGSQDKTLKLWDVAAGEELDSFTAEGIFSCVRFSNDEKKVIATNWDATVRVWKLEHDRLNALTPFSYALSTLDVAFLPDEKHFVCGTLPGYILLCDAETGNIQKSFEGHSERVHSVAVLNEGKQLLSASHDSTLRLWDVETAKTERVYLGHKGVVNEVRMLPGVKYFLSCGADRTLRLWDVVSRRELARGIGSGDLRGLSIAPDGKSCLTAGLDGSLWEWELPNASDLTLGSSDRFVPEMRTSKAFQAEYTQRRTLQLRPTDIFIEIDPRTNQPLFALDWGPADGLDFIVHHDMSDIVLGQLKAYAIQHGFLREQVKTTTINGVNHHIGLWTKDVTPPPP